MFRVLVSEKQHFMPSEQHFMPSEPGKDGETKSDSQINNVVDLVEALHQRRQEWSTTGHAAKTYVVSNQDSIKMHINMYLGHMSRFFFGDVLEEVNALVLDASDMGTSLVFDIFGIHNIVVPNYYKGSTDFEIMRQRMPLCMSLPVSVEDYIKRFNLSLKN